MILNYVSNSFRERSIKSMNVKTFYFISLASLAVISTLAGYLIFQIFYYGYYETWVSISIVVTSYGMGDLVIWLSFLFFMWYSSSHGFVILLYFLSTTLIAFNLIFTVAFVYVKLNRHTRQSWRICRKFRRSFRRQISISKHYLQNLVIHVIFQYLAYNCHLDKLLQRKIIHN